MPLLYWTSKRRFWSQAICFGSLAARMVTTDNVQAPSSRSQASTVSCAIGDRDGDVSFGIAWNSTLNSQSAVLPPLDNLARLARQLPP